MSPQERRSRPSGPRSPLAFDPSRTTTGAPRKGGNTCPSPAASTAARSTPEPDPLKAVESDGNLAEDAAIEITELEQGYRDPAKAEADRLKRAIDSKFWFAVWFDSREEKEHLLPRAGLMDIGDKHLDGREVADRLVVDLD